MARTLPTGWRRWVLAARPATLWAGVAPVLVGSALVWDRYRPCTNGTGCVDGTVARFQWDAFWAALVVAVAIQIAVNFANDVADAQRGADTADRRGPVRAVAAGLITPKQMWRGIGVAFAIAGLAGLYLFTVRGWPVLVIGLISALAALGYTNGPIPYGYYGLGEVFVFVFFGLVATVGTHYVHDGTAPAEAWLLGTVMGLLATAILVANNIRDIDTDAAAGKRTLAVILGRRRTAWLYAATVVGSFTIVLLAALAGAIPPWVAFGLAAAPLVYPLLRIVWTETAAPELIKALKGTARLQLAVALLIVAGALIAARG